MQTLTAVTVQHFSKGWAFETPSHTPLAVHPLT